MLPCRIGLRRRFRLNAQLAELRGEPGCSFFGLSRSLFGLSRSLFGMNRSLFGVGRSVFGKNCALLPGENQLVFMVVPA